MLKTLKKLLFKNNNQKQTILKNTFWLVAGEMISRFGRFFIVIYAARMLGVDGWGVFSYVLGIGGLIMLFSDIGLSAYVTREYTKKDELFLNLVSTAFILKMTVLIISTLLVIILGPFLSSIPQSNYLLFWVAIILFFDSLREFGFAFNRAFETMEWEAFVKIISSTTLIFIGFFLLKNNPTPQSLVLTYTIASFFGCAAIYWILRNKISILLYHFQFRLIKQILTVALAFSFVSLLGSILTNSDIYMLGLWKTPQEIGFYAAGQRLYQFFLVIPTILSMALFPIFSRLNNNHDEFSSMLQRSIKTAITIGIPVTVGGIMFASQIIQTVLGAAYLPAVPIFQVLIIMIVISFPSVVLSHAIFATNKQNILVKASIIGAIINIILNIFLILHFGAIGSAISSLLALCIATGLISLQMSKKYSFSLFYGIKKPLIASVFMIISCALLQLTNIYFIISIVLSSIIYIMSLIMLKDSTMTELKEFFVSIK